MALRKSHMRRRGVSAERSGSFEPIRATGWVLTEGRRVDAAPGRRNAVDTRTDAQAVASTSVEAMSVSSSSWPGVGMIGAPARPRSRSNASSSRLARSTGPWAEATVRAPNDSTASTWRA